MEYPIMEPPFEIQSFSELSAKESKALLNWFVSQIPVRLDLLQKAIKHTTDDSNEFLDFSPLSLIPLWRWFLDQIEIKEKTQEEIIIEKLNIPEQLRNIIEVKTQELSVGTQILAMDIAIYTAEVLIRSHAEIKWGRIRKPKTSIDVNRPVLLSNSSKVVINPTNEISNLTGQMVRIGNTNEAILKEKYDSWVYFFSNNHLKEY